MNLLSMSPILGAMMSNVKRYDCSTVKETSKFNVKFEGRFLGYDAKSIPRRYVYTCSNHRNSLSEIRSFRPDRGSFRPEYEVVSPGMRVHTYRYVRGRHF